MLRGLGDATSDLLTGAGIDVAPSIPTPDLFSGTYPASVTQAPPGTADDFQAAMKALQGALPTIALTLQQRQILAVQQQRMAAGLPPLDASQYGVGVSVGLSSQTQTLLLAGGALLAFMLLRRRG
jgi:hypothetical protein